MEKYSIFLGLRNLKIVNIQNSKESLPDVKTIQKGQIGNYLKSEGVFTFDLESSDQWLEVQIDFRDLAAVIFFEVKVPLETPIASLRKFICDLLNHILFAESNSLTYSEEQIIIQRIKMTEEVLLATDLKSSMVTQTSKVRKIKDLNDGQTVGETMSYINRYVLCTPLAGKVGQSGVRRKSIIREAYNPTIMKVLQDTSFNFQVRAPRTEPKIFRKNKGEPLKSGEKPVVDAQNSSVCNCCIG
jgi:hypothetical protein